MAQFGLGLVRFGHFGLNDGGQGIGHPVRQWCPIMSPAPHRHSAYPEKSSRCRVAPKRNPEDKIMATAGQSTFEAR
jgi:hypothetical protein